MTDLRIHHVDRVVAPFGTKRARAIRPSGLAPDSHKRYDFDTLFYQAVRCGNRVTLIAPKLLNFKKLLRKSKLKIDGQPVRNMRIICFYRHAIVHLNKAPIGDILTVEYPCGAVAETKIHSADLDFLSGLNCQMMVSKDNDLRWIHDQLRFHVARCELDAVCFIDNGSTAYSLQELGDTIRKTGLKKAVLISMPYAWGGVNRKPMHRELYLQTSSYNLCRIMYLQQARAVVRLDADEVLSPQAPGQSVFDAAVNTRSGFVRFSGSNRFPLPDAPVPVQFSDHTLEEPTNPVAGNNWCINPKGPLGRFQWRCHNLEHNILGDFQMMKGSYFFHCLGIGTGWKHSDRASNAQDLRVDPEAERFWTQDFRPAVDAGQDYANAI